MSRLKRESVTHIMTKELQTITFQDRLSDVGKVFTENKFHHLPVVSGAKLIGIISFVDLMRVSFADSFGVTQEQGVYDVLDRTHSVETIMAKDPVVIQSSQTIKDAAEKLASSDFHALPVVGGDHELLGMVTSSDLITYLVEQF